MALESGCLVVFKNAVSRDLPPWIGIVVDVNKTEAQATILWAAASHVWAHDLTDLEKIDADSAIIA